MMAELIRIGLKYADAEESGAVRRVSLPQIDCGKLGDLPISDALVKDQESAAEAERYAASL